MTAEGPLDAADVGGPRPGGRHAWLSSTRVLAGVVFVVAALVYLPSTGNGFAYDDEVIIALDSRLHDLSLAPRIFVQSYWPNPDVGLYRPLASLSFAVDWAIAGASPAWFHLMNVLWNAGASVLAFLVLNSLVAAPAAVAGALIFAVHPVHVEAVANVVGRAEVMAAFFCFAAFLIWLRAPDGAPLTWRRLAAVCLCFALALLSKESAIMVPALLALLDAARGMLAPGTRLIWFRRHLRAVVALGSVAAAYLLVRHMVVGGIGPAVLDPLLDVATGPGQRILTALQAWPEFLRLLVFPLVLLADYGPPIMLPATGLTPAAAAGALIAGSLVIGGLYALHAGRGRLACALLFLPVALLPVSNLIVPIGVLVAERALYLPSFGLALAVAFAAAAVRPGHVTTAAAVVAGVVILLAARSVHRIPAWESTEVVFDTLRRQRPDAFRVQWYDARVAADAEQSALAIQHFARAFDTWPFRRQMVVEAAAYAGQVGSLEFGQRLVDFAVERWPDDVAFLRMNAGVRLDRGDVVGALRMIERGLAVEPTDSLLLAMRRAVAPAAP